MKILKITAIWALLGLTGCVTPQPSEPESVSLPPISMYEVVPHSMSESVVVQVAVVADNSGVVEQPQSPVYMVSNQYHTAELIYTQETCYPDACNQYIVSEASINEVKSERNRNSK